MILFELFMIIINIYAWGFLIGISVISGLIVIYIKLHKKTDISYVNQLIKHLNRGHHENHKIK